MRSGGSDLILIRGAREHNLAIDELRIPKQRLVVFTGVSGSGKSSLAFDTLYAEGQRRYVESLSSYARQFLGQLEKPKYDHIRGLCPTVAIEQKTAVSNPRSTVGTTTEVYDYLRVLFARVGEQRCPRCGGEVAGRSASEIVAELLALPDRTRIVLFAPIVEHRKGEFKEELAALGRDGFVRVRVDGRVHTLAELGPLDKKRKHTIEVVVDRLVLASEARARLADSVETALRTAKGRVLVELEGHPARLYSEERSCPRCGIALPELTPQSLSHNSPLGMCPACSGLGSRLAVDPARIVPDPNLSIDQGAVEPWRNVAENTGWTSRIVHALCKNLKVPRDVPWKKLERAEARALAVGRRRAPDRRRMERPALQGIVGDALGRARAANHAALRGDELGGDARQILQVSARGGVPRLRGYPPPAQKRGRCTSRGGA